MAEDQGEVVIVGADGTEHVFPSGFDPKKAAAIVRGGGATAGVDTGAPPDTSNLTRLASMARDLGIGALKGGAHTALDAAQALRYVPGVATVTDAVGNAVGGAASRALYGRTAQPVSGDAAMKQAGDETKYANTTQTVGGGLETLAELAIPVTKGVKAIPSAERAGKAFQSVMGAAKSVPVDVTSSGQVALRIQELADRGASMPMVVRKFLNRITNPSVGPMTYEEARDFASNISRLSANEYQRLSPAVAREVAGLRVTLNKSIGDAAQVAGKGAEYASAMKEYAQAQKVKAALDDVWQGAKRAFPYASGAGAGLYLAQKLKDVIGGSEK